MFYKYIFQSFILRAIHLHVKLVKCLISECIFVLVLRKGFIYKLTSKA